MYVEDADENNRVALNSNFPHLLVVEGKEGGLLYEMICRFAGVDDKIELRSVNGNDATAFRKAIKPLVAVGFHLQTVAIIRDAEEHPVRAWQSVCSAFTQAGLPVPARSGVLSTHSSTLQTAALIVPAAHQKGSMETLCWLSLVGQPLADCVEDFLTCAWNADKTSKPTTQALTDKARIRALLAVGASIPRPVKPDKRFIEVIKENKFWDWSHQAFTPIVDFVKAVARV
jgi:hypothetical protein